MGRRRHGDRCHMSPARRAFDQLITGQGSWSSPHAGEPLTVHSTRLVHTTPCTPGIGIAMRLTARPSASRVRPQASSPSTTMWVMWPCSRVALDSTSAGHELVAHAVEDEVAGDLVGADGKEGLAGVRGRVGVAVAAPVLPPLGSDGPRAVADRQAVDVHPLTVQLERSGDTADLVEVVRLPGLALTGRAHPRLHHGVVLEVEVDHALVLETESVPGQGLERLHRHPARKAEVAEVALGREPEVAVVAVVRDLPVQEGGLVPDPAPTAGDADVGSNPVVEPATEMSLGDEEPEPARLVEPPRVVRWRVEVVVLGGQQALVAFAHGLNAR